jgi:hypothetical protein
MHFRIRCRVDSHEWTTQGAKITSPENLETIRQTLEDSSVIVEHWFYCGSSAPDRLVFDDFDNFIEYLSTKAWAGDIIYIWNFGELCKDDNTLANGKCPAEDGCVPRKGAY